MKKGTKKSKMWNSNKPPPRDHATSITRAGILLCTDYDYHKRNAGLCAKSISMLDTFQRSLVT